MARKILAVIFACALVLCVAGCDGNSTSPSSVKAASSYSSATATDSLSSYIDESKALHEELVTAMDAAHDAESAGDVAAAQAAKKNSDAAYGKIVQREKAPEGAERVDKELRECAWNMSMISAFYADATEAKANGNSAQYQDDLDELAVEIPRLEANEKELQSELKALTEKLK